MAEPRRSCSKAERVETGGTQTDEGLSEHKWPALTAGFIGDVWGGQ